MCVLYKSTFNIELNANAHETPVDTLIYSHNIGCGNPISRCILLMRSQRIVHVISIPFYSCDHRPIYTALHLNNSSENLLLCTALEGEHVWAEMKAKEKWYLFECKRRTLRSQQRMLHTYLSSNSLFFLVIPFPFAHALRSFGCFLALRWIPCNRFNSWGLI